MLGYMCLHVSVGFSIIYSYFLYIVHEYVLRPVVPDLGLIIPLEFMNRKEEIIFSAAQNLVHFQFSVIFCFFTLRSRSSL